MCTAGACVSESSVVHQSVHQEPLTMLPGLYVCMRVPMCGGCVGGYGVRACGLHSTCQDVVWCEHAGLRMPT